MVRQFRRLLALLAVVAAGQVCLPGAAVAAGVPADYMTMVSGGKGAKGDGAARLYDELQLTSDRTGHLRVHGRAGNDEFSISLSGPDGVALAPGEHRLGSTVALSSPDRFSMFMTDYGYNENGCEVTEGTFTIQEIAADLSRFSATWAGRCDLGPWVFGEVRRGIPAADPDLRAAPDTVHWPVQEPGAAARAVPVRLYNSSSAPLTVSGAAVTDGSPEFSVTSSSCTTLAPGGSCSVMVGFTPAASGPRTGTLTITDSSPAGSHTVPLLGEGAAGHTSFELYGPAGHKAFAGYGVHTRADAVFAGSGWQRSLGVAMETPGGQYWSLGLSVPEAAAPLTAGTTVTDADPDNYSDTRANVWLLNRKYAAGCGQLGTATIHELEWKTVGEGPSTEWFLQRLAVSFQLRCSGTSTLMYGSVAYNAESPAPPVGGITGQAPDGVSGLGGSGMLGAATLHWTNPATPDWTRTVVRGAAGATAPTSPTSGGFAVYSGTGSSTGLDSLAPGTPYSFAAWTKDDEGNWGPRRTVTLPASVLTVRTSKGTVAYGDPVKLSGTLTDAVTKAGTAGRRVHVYGRLLGDTAWYYAGTATTSSTGAWSLTANPGATGEYQAYFDGAGSRLGDASGLVTVRVSMYVDVALSQRTAALGRTVTVYMAATPGKRGTVVSLQQLRGGEWTTIATKKLNGEHQAEFAVRPSARGTFSYRVQAPGDATHVTGHSKTLKLSVT